MGVGPHLFGLRWTTRTNPDDGTTRANQLRVSGDILLIPDRLRWTSSVNFDAGENFLQLQRHIFEYTGSCYAMRLEYGEFRSHTTLEQKLELLEANGVDVVYLVHFDEARSRTEPATFVEQVFVDALKARRSWWGRTSTSGGGARATSTACARWARRSASTCGASS